ncbi:C-Jun-amino-terminal kinase-interacting protein 4-like [Anneissia japonica]|uniref:C-Jun-amino-terminal kinase-interacting protein 4-like n=1 Tax=Anneissia japonica TaxID=1529436 RepID=UPI0014259B21|nr:C-Jun-amino-terminal kinase-interacting protein 4-like [Anneissia japonica]
MDDGLETVYGTDDGNRNVMSEKVTGLASGIYREFERMIKRYDEDVVKELMPLIVNVLEGLDTALLQNIENDVELELLRDDNEQLMTQYDREKQHRKESEQKLLEYEDTNDQERRSLQNRLESLESSQKHSQLKLKNLTDQISRHEEREGELKKDYNILQKRHNEMLQNYAENIEKLKQATQFGDPVAASPRLFKLHIPRAHSPTYYNQEPPTPTKDSNVIQDSLPTPDAPQKTFLSKEKPNDSNLQLEIENTPVTRSRSVSTSSIEQTATETQASVIMSNKETEMTPDVEMSPQLAAVFASTPELKDGQQQVATSPRALLSGFSDMDAHNSLFMELDQDIISEIDDGANITDPAEFSVKSPDKLCGMGKEVENLITENSELRATKNALNIVKDDLILKVDELTAESELLRQDVAAVTHKKEELLDRIQELESELKKMKEQHHDLNRLPDGEEEEVPMAQRKRFTRVEMARVLMERNQYKERLMELQEAVRWTEMIRASREHPSFEKKNKSSVWKFFSGLFSTSTQPNKKPYPPANVKFNAPSSQVTPAPKQRSQTIASLGEKGKPFEFLDDGDATQRVKERREQYKKVKAHVKKDDGRVQAYGWSLPAKHQPPSKSIQPAESNRGCLVGVPVPVFCRPLLEKEPGTKIWCAAGVNLTGGRTRDGGSIVGASVFYSASNLEDGQNTSQTSESEVDKLDEELKQAKKEQEECQKNNLSSLVWICTSTQAVGKVTVVDANQPQNILDSFPVSDSYVLCICSVPGALESDYPSIEETEATTEDEKEKASDSKEEDKFGTVTLVSVSVPSTPRSTTPSSDRADQTSISSQEFKAEVGEANVSTNITSSTDAEEALRQAATTPQTQSKIGMEGVVPESKILNSQDQTDSDNESDVQQDPLGVTSLQSEAAKRARSASQDASDFLKDGLSVVQMENDFMYVEAEKMSSVKPTMWLGGQNGCLYVHSAVSQWRRCLHSLKLKDSILAIVYVKGRVFVAIADGSIAVFHRSADGQWDLNNYHLLDLGKPNHSIRCLMVVYDKVWCGVRNKIHIINPLMLKIEKSFDAHPRKESQVRQIAWQGDGVWVSIRLDSTLRLYHAHTCDHLQDVDIEPYVSKMLGTGKLGFSFVRITALKIACNRLWVGTGNGVIISIPLSEATKSTASNTGVRPGGVIRVYADSNSDTVRPGSMIPYCSITQAQLSFHGHRDAVKFFVAVPVIEKSIVSYGLGVWRNLKQGIASNVRSTTASGAPIAGDQQTSKNILVLSGGEGYIDFRQGDDEDEEAAGGNLGDMPNKQMKSERSHLIVWQVTGVSE